jgi:hypothetical protein
MVTKTKQMYTLWMRTRKEKKKKYYNVFSCYYSYLYPSCMCTFFFLRNVFLCGHTKKTFTCSYGWMLCVNLFLSRPTAFFFIFFSYTHFVFDCLFAVLYHFLSCILCCFLKHWLSLSIFLSFFFFFIILLRRKIYKHIMCQN